MSGAFSSASSVSCGNSLKSDQVENISWDYSKHPVHFLGQLHRGRNTQSNLQELYRVAESQFQLAQVILSTANVEVFVEGTMTDDFINPSKYRELSAIPGNLAHDLPFKFPNGFPAQFIALNRDQWELLGLMGTPQLLWSLGKLPHVRGTATEAEDVESRRAEEKLIKKFGSFRQAFLDSSDFRKLILDKREQLAVSNVQKFMNSDEYRGQPIILIFGEGHSFPEIDRINNQFNWQGSFNYLFRWLKRVE
jgi:hypothetical protein